MPADERRPNEDSTMPLIWRMWWVVRRARLRLRGWAERRGIA